MMCLVIGALFLISSVYGAGEFSVLHTPGSLIFQGSDQVKESTLTDIYAVALGFNNKHYSQWQGLVIENPFELPEAVVTVAVDGVQDIDLVNGVNFPLTTNEDESKVYKNLITRIKGNYATEKPNLVRVSLENGLDDLRKYDEFKTIKDENPQQITYKHLKSEVEEDREFLKDIALLNEISQRIDNGVIKPDYVPDVYWFRLSSLHALSDLHGLNSTQAVEARQLLRDALNRLSESFINAYDGKVLVNVITSDVSHTRTRRHILAEDESAAPPAPAPAKSDKQKYNLASKYGKNYPAIFNIILWFVVVMAFSLLAICLVTANMDPGRDSIIYRMTSTRMKKDN